MMQQVCWHNCNTSISSSTWPINVMLILRMFLPLFLIPQNSGSKLVTKCLTQIYMDFAYSSNTIVIEGWKSAIQAAGYPKISIFLHFGSYNLPPPHFW